MNTTRRTDETDRPSARPARWLPALEQALKSRVGWVDETVSPFAGSAPRAQAPGNIRNRKVQTGKAA